MNKSLSIGTLRILNWIGFIATVTVNALAVILPLNGQDTGKLSDSYPNLFVPAGLTFSIWGVIYLLLLLFSLYQTGWLGPKGQKSFPMVERLGTLFFFISLANVLWIFMWHYLQVALSMLVMVILLGLLMTAYSRLMSMSDSLREKWFVKVPISVYMGWISVATIANATALLVNIKWNGWGVSEPVWTIIMIGIATLLSIYLLLAKKDIAFSLVVVWALWGIRVKHIETFKSAHPDIITTTVIGMTAISACILYVAVKRLMENTKQKNPS